jgi:diaminopropionate ammonia-lyase
MTQSPADLLKLCPAHRATPLLDLPDLARALGVARIFVKDEGRRALGSFKSLGGVYAGLSALSRAIGCDFADLVDGARRARDFTLLAASDGNHGLAVAAAARLAGANARLFLPAAASAARIARIAAKGGETVTIAGTYDDAVLAAREAARDRRSLLIPDTSDDPGDPVVADVMRGYAVLVDEIRAQLVAAAAGAPTHIFVQAGVGGLAAAIAEGFGDMRAHLVVIEPKHAACVGAGLAAGRPVRVAGTLETAADMLSCGEASASALNVLLGRQARALAVTETALARAPAFLSAHGGPITTVTGATGLAGLQAALADETLAAGFLLNDQSRVLLLATEAAPPEPGAALV